MTPVEIIALIFALAVILKLILFYTIDPKKWLKFMEKFFNKIALMNVLMLLFAVVILAFLLQEINIIQIWVAALFGMILYGLVMVYYHKGYLKIVDQVFKDRKKAWFIWLVFLAMSIWVLYALFA